MKRDWKKWGIAALIRAVKTFFQSFLSFVTLGLAFHEIPWTQALSVSGVAFVYSIITSLAGIPEAEDQPVIVEPPDDEANG